MPAKPRSWDDLSDPQVKALSKLHFAIPIHQTYAMRMLKIAGNTLHSLEKMNLVRRVYLRENTGMHSVVMPFFTLTQRGQQIVRGWKSWNTQVFKSLGVRPSDLHDR